MKTIQLTMTTAEKKPRTVQVVDLKSGENVSGAAITHTPPAGGTVVEMAATVTTSPYIDFVLGPFPDIGTHLVDVQATGSATPASKPVVRYIIEVK